jgi:ParB/RepB/Spo0J family partition protein
VAAKRPVPKLSSIDELLLLSEQGQAQLEQSSGIQTVPINKIRMYKNHPFRLYDGERLADMVSSIESNGVLIPVILRKIEADENDCDHEMLTGHNRMNAAQLLGLKQLPAIVKENLTDEEALMYVVETNVLQRSFSHMLPSEKAKVLALRYSEMFSQGKRNDIKPCLIELYNQFHITWTTDIAKLQSINFPTFSDLYQLIQYKEQSLGDHVYKELSLLLYDIAHGGDSFLWNGHSTNHTRSRCICLDTHSLQNTSDNIKRTQYFNLLSWCWEQMSQDRSEQVLLICDESYLMIDPQVPQSLVFLRNVEKRARKYEAVLAIISHSVVDFLAPEIKVYGQALLDIPCIKILMGTDGKNLQETRELYNLTDAEEELLASKKREHAVLMIGSKRIHAHFEIPDYKFAYMGSAGGR